MKRIHTETRGNKTAKVYRDSDYQEYRVRLYIDGKLHAPADYFTDCGSDAIETAIAMVSPRAPRPLNVAFNVAVLHITDKCLPCGFDVSADAPQCYDSLVTHHEKTGRVLVWNGASGQTVFADADVNYAFRAWHDSKHILGGYPFNAAGKFRACLDQCRDIRAIFDGAQANLFCDILQAEIMGQFWYSERNGGFPIDQIGFARAYLVNSAAALKGDFGISREAA